MMEVLHDDLINSFLFFHSSSLYIKKYKEMERIDIRHGLFILLFLVITIIIVAGFAGIIDINREKNKSKELSSSPDSSSDSSESGVSEFHRHRYRMPYRGMYHNRYYRKYPRHHRYDRYPFMYSTIDEDDCAQKCEITPGCDDYVFRRRVDGLPTCTLIN